MLKGLYDEETAKTMDTNTADLTFSGIPFKILAGLEKAGFQLDFGEDESGLFCKYLRRGSGYYIDVGACESIANGDIKMKPRVTISKMHKNSVEFCAGTS